MQSSLTKIGSLPDDTEVYFGHEYTLVSYVTFSVFCKLHNVLKFKTGN